jgi:ABC-type oligopeptide transport system substrate-binding subunit
MTAKLTSKLVLAAALLLSAAPALASDATESGFSSNGATVYPVYAAKDSAPAPEKKDAPKEEQAQDRACECHG